MPTDPKLLAQLTDEDLNKAHADTIRRIAEAAEERHALAQEMQRRLADVRDEQAAFARGLPDDMLASLPPGSAVVIPAGVGAKGSALTATSPAPPKRAPRAGKED